MNSLAAWTKSKRGVGAVDYSRNTITPRKRQRPYVLPREKCITKR